MEWKQTPPLKPPSGPLECSPLKLGLRHPEICLKETSSVSFCFLAVLSLGSFKSVLRVRKDTERRRAEWVRAQASPVPRRACALHCEGAGEEAGHGGRGRRHPAGTAQICFSPAWGAEAASGVVFCKGWLALSNMEEALASVITCKRD